MEFLVKNNIKQINEFLVKNHVQLVNTDKIGIYNRTLPGNVNKDVSLLKPNDMFAIEWIAGPNTVKRGLGIVSTSSYSYNTYNETILCLIKVGAGNEIRGVRLNDSWDFDAESGDKICEVTDKEADFLFDIVNGLSEDDLNSKKGKDLGNFRFNG